MGLKDLTLTQWKSAMTTELLKLFSVKWINWTLGERVRILFSRRLLCRSLKFFKWMWPKIKLSLGFYPPLILTHTHTHTFFSLSLWEISTKYASFTLKGYFALPLILYLNGFAPGEEIFSKNPSRREGHYCPNPLTRSHFKTGVFGGWDGVLSSLSHPKSFQAGRESKGSALASISHLSKVSSSR